MVDIGLLYTKVDKLDKGLVCSRFKYVRLMFTKNVAPILGGLLVCTRNEIDVFFTQPTRQKPEGKESFLDNECY